MLILENFSHQLYDKYYTRIADFMFVYTALYNNVGEEGDELLFNQGDMLTVIEQLNEEWLMCQRGNESGIVKLKYIILLKLPIILSGNSFNFYLLFLPTFYYISMQMCYKKQYLTYKTQNISFIILISHLMYNKSFSTCVMDTSNI